jgi:hypothetical protein
MTYEVHFRYYQYNTGRGDNGYRTGKREFSLRSEAEVAYNEILAAYQKHYSDDDQIVEEEARVVDKYLPDDGYFCDPPSLYEVSRTQLMCEPLDIRSPF